MDGILIIDKPLGITSHDVVQRVRRVLQTKKVGHAGTLDPQASGVLVLGVGKATRLLEYLVADDKEYLADIELGATSSTEDSEGELTVQSSGPWPEEGVIQGVLQRFLGPQQQRPPLYSALKQGGEALYVKARRGETVEIPTRPIEIFLVELLEYSPPRLSLRVTCSKGTYIRSLARDIGEALGTGAYLAGLRRTRSGSHTLAEAVDLAELEGSTQPESFLQPLAAAVSGLPSIMVTQAQAVELGQGKRVEVTSEISAAVVAVFLQEDSPRFVGIALVEGGVTLVPHKIFSVEGLTQGLT